MLARCARRLLATRTVAPGGVPDVITVLDVETSGLSASHHRILELAAVRVPAALLLCEGAPPTSRAPLAALHALVAPPASMRLSASVQQLTGLTKERIRAEAAGPIEAVLPSFLAFVSGTRPAGHNVSFDLGFLREELRRVPFARDYNAHMGMLQGKRHAALDTLALSRRVLPDAGSHRLSSLAEKLQLRERPAHRALDDVLTTVDLLHALLMRMEPRERVAMLAATPSWAAAS